MSESAFFLELVESGFLRVDPGGAIWRLQAFGRTGSRRAVTPRRAEHRRRDGYLRVRIAVGGREHSILAHRLVWLAAERSIPEGMELNHRDGQRDHNALSNLEIVTKSENLQHAYDELGRTRVTGARNGRSKLTETQAAMICERARAGEAKRALAREYGVSPAAVRKVIAREAVGT